MSFVSALGLTFELVDVRGLLLDRGLQASGLRWTDRPHEMGTRVGKGREVASFMTI